MKKTIFLVCAVFVPVMVFMASCDDLAGPPDSSPVPSVTPRASSTPDPAATPQPTKEPADDATPDPLASPVTTATPDPAATPDPTATPAATPSPVPGSTRLAPGLPAGTVTTAVDYSATTNSGWSIYAMSEGLDGWYAVTVGSKPDDFVMGDYSVWGANPYTHDSNLAVAAVHAGAIGINGGTFYVHVTTGLSSYEGNTFNGVTTTAYGSWSGSVYIYR